MSDTAKVVGFEGELNGAPASWGTAVLRDVRGDFYNSMLQRGPIKLHDIEELVEMGTLTLCNIPCTLPSREARLMVLVIDETHERACDFKTDSPSEHIFHKPHRTFVIYTDAQFERYLRDAVDHAVAHSKSHETMLTLMGTVSDDPRPHVARVRLIEPERRDKAIRTSRAMLARHPAALAVFEAAIDVNLQIPIE